ncbi:hypothetical protein BGZ76_002266 [Entomortierella beljakovae]|nr:hypothetical protein BGZ76_002266 [Entomortierella beljakovae]
MGSSLSKSKKKNQSSTGKNSKKKAKGSSSQHQKPTDVAIPQNPQQWSAKHSMQPQQLQPHEIKQQQLLQLQEQYMHQKQQPPLPHSQQQQQQQQLDYNNSGIQPFGDSGQSYARGHSLDQSKPENNNRTLRNSGNDTQHGNINQPRTSHSHSRTSFSIIRGRKSTQLQREGEGSQTVMQISSPIIDPEYPTEFPQGFQLKDHPIDQPRATSGAYRAPVPSLPVNISQSLPPPPQMSTPTPPTSDFPTFPSPPGTSLATVQEPQRLWRESLRNAAAMEGRDPENIQARSNSINSHSSISSSVYSSSGTDHKRNKPISGSTFATTLSPSNASQASFNTNRSHTNKANVIHPETSPDMRRSFDRSRDYQDSNNDNASTITLPGSRYIGRDGSLRSVDDDSISGPNVLLNRNASELSLMGSALSIAGASGSPSLSGVNTQNHRYDSQFQSPRHSGSIPQLQNLQQKGLLRQNSPSMTSEHFSQDSSFKSGLGLSTKIVPSSARESVSSISTANFQWMEEQSESPAIKDVINRESIMMLFHSPNRPELGSNTQTISKNILSSLSREEQTHQLYEHQVKQHALLKCFFRGNYHAPLDKLNLGSILDVGCGSGLWMNDMATEFPLTEIHGVDINVPSRRRRAKTTRQMSDSSNPSSPSLNHSSSFTDSNSAETDALPSNCFFHKADISAGLPFADNVFDYCHVRLVLWGYPLNSFPDLLNELIRVTKKGGWVEFVDMDPCILKATETGECINEWIKTGLIHSNMDPDLVKTLPKFLKEYCDSTLEAAQPESTPVENIRNSLPLVHPSQAYGLENLKVSKISLPFGSWGGQIGELWEQTYVSFLKGLETMMMDATLSGLVMDQYHRQCQLEMQQAVEVNTSKRLSGSGDQRSERVTSFDQRLCTHKAWHHLIQRLVNDASQSYTNPSGGLASPTSIKQMRSYNNIYVSYAQKVDIMDMKQQLLLRQLEQEILNPNPNPNPNVGSGAMFNIEAASGTFGGPQLRKPPQDQKPVQHQRQDSVEVYDNLEKNKRLASTLRQKYSSPNLSRQYSSESTFPPLDEANVQQNPEVEENKNQSFSPRNRNRYGFVASLTQDALETFNRANNGEDDIGTESSSSAMAVAPTPTSIRGLSIRSSSRNSNRNESISSSNGIMGAPLAVATPGSVTSTSGPHSPRVAANGPKRFESVQNSQSDSPDETHSDQAESEDNSNSSESDYFGQDQAFRPAAYHQQQIKHHQQQMGALKKTPSLLSQVLVTASTAAAAGAAKDAAFESTNHTEDHEQEEDVEEAKERKEEEERENGEDRDGHRDEPTNQCVDSHSAEIIPEVVQEESDILIALDDSVKDEQEGNDDYSLSLGGRRDSDAVAGVVPEHTASARERLVPIESMGASIGDFYRDDEMDEIGHEGPIKIINQVPESISNRDSVPDESQLQILPVGEEEEEEEEEGVGGGEAEGEEAEGEEEVIVMMTPRRNHTDEQGHSSEPCSKEAEDKDFTFNVPISREILFQHPH